MNKVEPALAPYRQALVFLLYSLYSSTMPLLLAQLSIRM